MQRGNESEFSSLLRICANIFWGHLNNEYYNKMTRYVRSFWKFEHSSNDCLMVALCVTFDSWLQVARLQISVLGRTLRLCGNNYSKAKKLRYIQHSIQLASVPPHEQYEHLYDYCSVYLQLRKKLAEKAKDGTLKANGEPKPAPKKRGRWDQTDDAPTPKKSSGTTATPTSWDNADVIKN